jgi:hypothetical protein
MLGAQQALIKCTCLSSYVTSIPDPPSGTMAQLVGALVSVLHCVRVALFSCFLLIFLVICRIRYSLDIHLEVRTSQSNSVAAYTEITILGAYKSHEEYNST